MEIGKNESNTARRLFFRLRASLSVRYQTAPRHTTDRKRMKKNNHEVCDHEDVNKAEDDTPERCNAAAVPAGATAAVVEADSDESIGGADEDEVF
jgi:hypothetical protein